jgi:hypothetical protein
VICDATSGDPDLLFERAVILRFVRDGLIIRTPGFASSDSVGSRFLDLDRNLISVSDLRVSEFSSGFAREIEGIQVLFGPRIGSGLDRIFLGRAQRLRSHFAFFFLRQITFC